VRVVGTIIALGACTAALAQTENPYLRIEAAIAQTQAQANVTMDATGWETTAGRTQHFQLRLFVSQGKVYAEQFVDNVRRLVVVAEGERVWRYDPLLNEYTFLKQPETPSKTVSLVTAWSRVQLQRPLRAVAGSVRWLTIPQFEDGRNHVRVFQTRPVRGDWRGTELMFVFDDQDRMDRMTIEDKHDLTEGFQHSWLESRFTYPATINVEFTFTPPRGAKPAADLPVRISGDGG
jgi:hypothetical protein